MADISGGAGAKVSLNPIGSLFSATWKSYKERFWVGIQILLIPILLLVVANLLRHHSLVLAIVFTVLGWLSLLFASIAIILGVSRGTDFKTSYAESGKIFWPFVWLAILNYFITLGGFIMLIIPGIIMTIWFVFSSYILILENKRGLNVLLQGREYVKGYWWGILGRHLLLGICIIAAFLIIELPAALLLGPIGAAVIYVILLLLAVPFSVAYVYEIYKNLKTLKPDVAARQATESRGFLMTSGIVGLIVPIIVFVLAIIVLGFSFFHGYQMMQNGSGTMPGMPVGGPIPITNPIIPNPGAPASGPVILELVPQSGPVGTEVTIYGANFSPTDTVEMDGLVGAKSAVASAEGTMLTFTIPSELGPNCKPNQACADFLRAVLPGSYQITVLTDSGTSNEMPFTVTAQ